MATDNNKRGMNNNGGGGSSSSRQAVPGCCCCRRGFHRRKWDEKRDRERERWANKDGEMQVNGIMRRLGNYWAVARDSCLASSLFESNLTCNGCSGRTRFSDISSSSRTTTMMTMAPIISYVVAVHRVANQACLTVSYFANNAP